MPVLTNVTKRIALRTATTSATPNHRYSHLLKCCYHDTPPRTARQTPPASLPYNSHRRRPTIGSAHAIRRFATGTYPSPYATVDHATAYSDEMSGRHGKQLALAYDEGKGKDVKRYPYVPEDDWENIDDYFDEEGDDDDAALLTDDDEEEEDNDGRRGGAVDAGALGSEPEYVTASRATGTEEGRYAADGFPVRPPSQRAAFRAGAPAGTLFAVVKLSGIQYKVAPDDLIISNKLLPVEKWAVGTTLTLRGEEVLMVGSTARTVVGLPFCPPGAEVDVMVEEITRDKKVVVFKKRRRKNSKRKKGFRREVTFLRVLDIRMPREEVAEDEVTSVA